MIRDGTVFDDDHLPSTIVGRNRHMNEVKDAPAPIQDGFRAENCFLFGPSRVGKRTIAKAAVRELRQEVLEVLYAYVNCWQDYTRNAVLKQISRDLVGDALPRSASTGRLIGRITADLNGPRRGHPQRGRPATREQGAVRPPRDSRDLVEYERDDGTEGVWTECPACGDVVAPE